MDKKPTYYQLNKQKVLASNAAYYKKTKYKLAPETQVFSIRYVPGGVNPFLNTVK
tara:strand:- start:899 stop:1063 length:165 start_codon:yes stop_codon:yes gene_type:complete